MDENKLKLMQQYLAAIAITASTLRNQGAEGVVEAARNFLARLKLDKLNKIQPFEYPTLLNRWTNVLKRKLPDGAQNWGTARKALNVFMVQLFTHKYLAERYALAKFCDVLETPLDSQSTKKLRQEAGRGRLPIWKGIKDLTPDDSAAYQNYAAEYARERGIPRACLDIVLWRH